MELTRDFKEFIRLLNESKVKYLLVGGYAVAAYGYPRFTQDIDIWIEPDKGNAEKLLAVLKQFGFGTLDITQDDLTKIDNIVQLGFPPNRIDILSGVTGLSFDECCELRSNS